RQEVVARRKDGTTFPIDLAVGEYRDGNRRSFVCIAGDITERRHTEERARRHEAELARGLRVSLVGELAPGMAHELSQPLAAIANMLEACAARLPALAPKAKAIRPLLRQAIAQSVQAGRIVRNVRELVRGQQPRRETADLRGLVEDAAGLVAGDI